MLDLLEYFVALGAMTTRQKCVHVNKYTRFRFGVKEYVREHWRSWPRTRLSM